MEKDYEDINEHARQKWKEETDGFDRVRDVMRNSTGEMTASEVAEGADVSPNTARKYLGRLAEMNQVTVTEEGKTGLYSWDESAEKMERVRTISRKYSKEKIEQRIREMTSEIQGHREKYDCEEPDDLVLRLEGESSEAWNDVSEWRSTRRNLAIAKTALAFKSVLQHSDSGGDREEITS